MKTFSLIAMTAFITLSTAAYGAEKKYSLSLSDPSKPASIEIEIYNGSVTVQGYEGKTIEISADVRQVTDEELERVNQGSHYRSPKQSKKNVRSNEGLKSVKNAMMHIEIEEDENEVEITSETRNQFVALIIKVPTMSSLDIELYTGGDINIDNVSGALEIETYKGGIYATNISGPIVAETAKTDIVVSFNTLSKSNPSSLTSHSGNVDVTFAKQVVANVNAQSYQGEIFSGLDQEFVAVDEISDKKKGKRQKVVLGGILQAKLNGGGQTLSLISYSGNLYVRKGK